MSIKTKVCPYNPAHVMPEISLAGHISKCTFKTNDFDSCKYNAMHIMRKEVLAEHEQRCPDKKKGTEEDDDWGFSEEVRENMKKELQEKRKQRKAQKKAESKPEPEMILSKLEEREEEPPTFFVEPDFAKIGQNPVNLTTIEESSNVLNESLMSKASRKKKGEVNIF